MPLYDLTSSKTGRTYQVEFANEPNDLDIDEVIAAFDAEDAAAPTEQPGFGTQLYESFAGGGGLALGGGRTSLGVLTGDVPGMAAGLSQMQQAQARLSASQTPEDVAFMEDIQKQAEELKQAKGFFPTLREAADLPLAALRRPGAALRTAVQSLPNIAITTPVTIAGGLAGAALGAPGSPVGSIVGAVATGGAANAAIEVGYALNDLLAERTNGASATMTEEQIAAYLEANPDIVDEAQRIGLTRGATIGAVEALGLKGAGRLTAAPARAAEQAARTALAREGVDLASTAAVREAMATPALRQAAETAAKAATDQFNLTGRALGAVGIETGTAAGAELAAQAAAGQEIDYGEAFLEMLGEGLAAPASVLAAQRVDMPRGSVLNLPAQRAVETAADAMGDEFPSVEELTAVAGPEAADEVAAAVADAATVAEPAAPEAPTEEVQVQQEVVVPEVQPVTVDIANQPSPNLAPRATENAPPRPVRQPGQNFREFKDQEEQWDSIYGGTHNVDGTPYQPTVLVETVAAALRALTSASFDERIDAVGTDIGIELGTGLTQLLNDGWVWDAQQRRMVDPQNRGESPLQALTRIRGGAAPAAQPAPAAPAAPATQPAAPRTRQIPVGDGTFIEVPVRETPTTPESLPAVEAEAAAAGEQPAIQTPDETEITEASGLPPVQEQPVVEAPAVNLEEGTALGSGQGEEEQVTSIPVQTATAAAPAQPISPLGEVPTESLPADTQPTSGDVGTVDALRAVATNTATPEQLNSLVSQGLARVVQGQPVITESGLAMLPSEERPRLTEAERVAEIEGQTQSRDEIAEEVTSAIEETLTNEEKQQAAEELNEPSWGPAALAKFKQAIADWSLRAATFSTKLVSLFKKVLGKGRQAVLAATIFVGSVNVTSEGKVETITPQVIEIPRVELQSSRAAALVPEMPTLSGISPQQVTTESSFPAVEGAAIKAPVTLPAGIEEAPMQVPSATFGGETASQDTADVANWIVRTNNAAGYPFLIADKRNGVVFLFDKDGKLIKKAPALFGKEVGDDIPPKFDPEEKTRRTPAGRFGATLDLSPSEAFYQSVIDFYETGDSVLAIHRLYTLDPSEDRPARLASATPADNRISYGCINLGDEVYFDTVAPAFEAGGVVYVLPETQRGRKTLPPLKGTKMTSAEESIRFSTNTPSTEISAPVRPLTGDAQRNETLARRRRGKPTVPTGLRTIDGAPLAGITPTLSQATQARTLEAAQTPGAQDTWIGTAEEYLAENPDAAFVTDNPTLEAFYDPAVDRAVILTDRVQVREGDAVRAARNGTSAGLEAVRRLIRHESFVHRGWRALPQNLKNEFLSISENVVPADDLDQLAKVYKRFASWRSDPSIRALAVEEWLAQRLERIEKLPASSDSVLNQLVDWAKRVWQWLAGDDSVEPTRAELVDLMRQMVRALETGEKEQTVAVESPTAESPADIRFSLTGNEAEIERIIREDRDDAESGVVPTRARPLAPGASPTSATETINGEEIIERNQLQKTSMMRTEDRAIEIVNKLGPMSTWMSTLLNAAWRQESGLDLRSPLGRLVVAESLLRVSNASKKDRLRFAELNRLLALEYQTGTTPSATVLATQSYITQSPRYAALFTVQAMIEQQRKNQAGIIDPQLGSTEGTVAATLNADTEAQQQATEDVDSELRLKDALYELGLAGQNPDTQQRIRRVNDNVFRLGVLARLREQMRARAEQASFVSLSASAVEAEYAAMSVEQLDAEAARLEKEVQDDLAALETERKKVRRTKPKGTVKTVVEQAQDLIARLEAAPGVKKTPKPNPVRDLYKAHLKQPMAEGDFIKDLTDMGVGAEDAQKLYDLAAVKIAAAEAVAAQKQAEREAARQAREAEKPTPAEAFAARTINEVANRLADPASTPAEKEQKVLPIRELYKEHVRDGLPLDVFVQRAVTAGLDEQTAFILHGVGTMERDAAETRRGYNEAGAAQRFAERVVDEAAARFADPALPQPVRNKRKNAIRELYAAHVKKPMGRDAFVEAARKLGVDERTAATMHGVGTMENEARAIQKDARNIENEARRLNDRTARLLDSDKNSLENLINKLRPKITGGLNWREVFDRPLTDQREWRQQLFDTLRADPALANLSPAEVRDLAAELDRVWNDKRLATFKALAKRMNLPGAKEGVKEKIAESAPALIRYINSGAFNNENFRNAIAGKFGVPPLDEARVDEVIALVQKAQAEGITQVERNKLMVEAIRLMQRELKVETGEMISNYWVTSVLSGFATLVDMALAVLNGARVMTQFSADAIIRQRDFKLAGRAAKRYFQSLGNAILESSYYFVSGDPSMLDNYQFTLNTYMREGSAAANPFDYFERLIRDPNRSSWAKVVPYYFAGLQRVMTAFDHINATSTAQGTLEHALAYNRKLFGDARMPSEQDVAAARAKAVELAGGDRTYAQKRKVTAYTRQILNEEYNKNFPGLLDEAKDIGRIVAYQNDPTGIGGMIYHTLLGLTNKWVSEAGNFRDAGRAQGEAQSLTSKFMREFMYILAVNARNISGTRFVRFVGNRVNELISFTPGAGFLRLYEKDTSPTRRAMLLQNQAVGIMVGAWVAMTVLRMMNDEDDDEKRGFRVSGSWQGLTPDRKNQLRANNQVPNSIQVWDGEKWVSFNYVAWPVASLLATVGNLNDMKKYHPEKWDPKSQLDRFLAAAWAGAFSFKDLSAISGFMELLGTSAYSSDPVDSAIKWLGKFSSNYIGGVVPRMLKDIDMIMDPKARKPTDVSEHFAKEVPFYRRTEAGGEKMFNIFGEQVELNRLPWRRVVTASRPEKEYQILAELNNRGLFLGVANADNRTVGMGASRRELTDEEAERYAVETGKRYRQFILDQGERLLEMDEARAKEFISRRTEALRNAALRDAIRTQP